MVSAYCIVWGGGRGKSQVPVVTTVPDRQKRSREDPATCPEFSNHALDTLCHLWTYIRGLDYRERGESVSRGRVTGKERDERPPITVICDKQVEKDVLQEGRISSSPFMVGFGSAADRVIDARLSVLKFGSIAYTSSITTALLRAWK